MAENNTIIPVSRGDIGKFTNKHVYVDYHKNLYINAVEKGRPRFRFFETMPDELLVRSGGKA
jgi:hypothetical protein